MTKSPKSPKTQISKFREIARETDCDTNEDRFGQVLKRVAKTPAPKSDKPKTAKHTG
jgi:hypothetical protein